jgi:hypothetical protein
MCNASKAIQCLEEFLFANPENINETIVANLCNLYDIALAEKSLEKKRIVFSYVTQHASDSFDYSVLRIPGLT